MNKRNLIKLKWKWMQLKLKVYENIICSKESKTKVAIKNDIKINLNNYIEI